MSATAPFLDTADPAFAWEAPEVARAREASWYARTPQGIAVLRHEEAAELLRDRRFVKGAERFMRAHGIERGPLYDWWTNMLSSLPADDHARLRGLVNKAFVGRVVERLRPAVRSTAERLAAPIAADEPCELVAAFADPLPSLVMCRLLGVPPEDYELFHRCSADIGLAYSSSLADALPRVDAAVAALGEYVDGLLADRRHALGDDLLSELIQVEQDGGRLSTDELRNLVLLLVWAGQDTTARQIGRALVAFAEHPEQWTLLARQPELALRAVEEVCRWSPQARGIWRFAAEDVAFHGLAIPAGTMVLACVVAANRDPRAFDDPERFDITAERDARQLAFGGGMSYCLGANVARLETAEGLCALTRRLGPPAIDGPIVWRPPTAFLHGPDVLPLRFSSSPSPA